MKMGIWFLTPILFLWAIVEADAQSGGGRPCGPASLKGPMRYLIPQGAYGADFRAACRAHDACYGREGADRATCDCQFRDQLMRECEGSRNPRRCKRIAMLMYRSVRKYGDQPFEESQKR